MSSMTRNELVTHLIAADYFRGQWTLNDREYSPFSVAFVRSAHAEWVKSLPDELTFQRDLGGGKTVRAVAWIPEAWNCNNIARDFGAFLSRCMGADAIRTKRGHGNIAGGKFDFLMDPASQGSGHTINWWIDHEGRVHHLDAATEQLDHLTPSQLATIFSGEST